MMYIASKAEELARIAHDGQSRKYGDRPYIYHPERVWEYIAQRSYATENMEAAAWLHDVVEDCDMSLASLAKMFNPEVARLVGEVSQPPTPTGMPRRARWPIYLEHYGSASLDGKRLKLADRLCNLLEYIDYRHELPEKEMDFIRSVYRRETNELIDRIGDADEETSGGIILALSKLACG